MNIAFNGNNRGNGQVGDFQRLEISLYSLVVLSELRNLLRTHLVDNELIYHLLVSGSQQAVLTRCYAHYSL